MSHVLPIQERLIGQREPNETFMHLVGLRTEAANIHQPFMVIQRELAEQRPREREDRVAEPGHHEAKEEDQRVEVGELANLRRKIVVAIGVHNGEPFGDTQ